jgi:hypothetical protein
VTLLIEYLAKPSLETRKDRIIERQRELRKIAATHSWLQYTIGQLLTYEDQEPPIDHAPGSRAVLGKLLAVRESSYAHGAEGEAEPARRGEAHGLVTGQESERTRSSAIAPSSASERMFAQPTSTAQYSNHDGELLGQADSRQVGSVPATHDSAER